MNVCSSGKISKRKCKFNLPLIWKFHYGGCGELKKHKQQQKPLGDVNLMSLCDFARFASLLIYVIINSPHEPRNEKLNSISLSSCCENDNLLLTAWLCCCKWKPTRPSSSKCSPKSILHTTAPAFLEQNYSSLRHFWHEIKLYVIEVICCGARMKPKVYFSRL